MIRVDRKPPKPKLSLSIDGTDYELQVASLDVPRFKVTKLGGEDTYDVSAGGCTCPAYVHGSNFTCKHVEALREVRLLA